MTIRTDHRKGGTWNVSRVYTDPVTGRQVRQVTRAEAGGFSIHPTFGSVRDLFGRVKET